MSIIAMYAGRADQREEWSTAVNAAAAASQLDIRLIDGPDMLATAGLAPSDVSYLLYAPNGPITDFAPYAGLKAILSLWAGVERALAASNLPASVPLVRMVEPGLSKGMRDYVVGHVLRAHLNIEKQRAAQAERRWDEALAPPLAEDRRVGVLGLGALGAHCAQALVGLGFQVSGWSRTPKSVEGVESLHGAEGLHPFLERSEILVCLLPLTSATEGLMDAAAFAALPDGAHLINAARGPIIDDAALLSALDQRLASATLDVFDVEPLPEDHPFWVHEKVFVTPHIASITRPETGSQRLISHIESCESGAIIAETVDTVRGY